MISRLSPAAQGIIYMVLAMASFGVMGVLIRGLSADIASPLMVFLRNAFALLFMVPWLLHRGIGVVKTNRLWRHAWRAFVGIVAMQLWFYSISIMPVSEAVALSFTSPLFVTAMALLFLGEKAGVRRWAALIIGFAGTLLIARPGTEIHGSGVTTVLIASALIAVTSILVKTLTKSESAGRILFYMAFFMTIFSLPPAIPYWKMLTPFQYAGMIVIAGTSVLAHIFLIKAYIRTDMVVLMPFDFTRLIFTSILAYFAFGEVLDFWSWVGAAVIVSSAAYITWREQKAKHVLTKKEKEATAGTLPV